MRLYLIRHAETDWNNERGNRIFPSMHLVSFWQKKPEKPFVIYRLILHTPVP